MSNKVKAAPCNFCGQMITIDADEHMTEAQEKEIATMCCNCDEAVEYKKEKKRKEKALENVEALFGKGAPEGERCNGEIVGLLKMGIELIHTGEVARMTVNLRGGIKATVSQNGKGEINVERTETKKKKLTE